MATDSRATELYGDFSEGSDKVSQAVLGTTRHWAHSAVDQLQAAGTGKRELDTRQF